MHKITTKHVEKQTHTGKETIHSGHFMVSHFEAEAQDDYDDLAVPVPDEEQTSQKVSVVTTYTVPGSLEQRLPSSKDETKPQQLCIEISLTKLFKCMTLAYRQKLTSPKWNRFKGIKLRWKDKIRLNNVIWRCWHMQFIKKQNTLVCQFASPLDVDTHVKPEATLLEGKYWKRRAEAVKAEYKKWRMFHITRLYGKGDTCVQDTTSEMDVECFAQCADFANNMLTDEDYLSFMSDTLFSTITNHQPFAFPDTREIARGASLADFIQPSLGPLQPNLEDFMDTLEPLQDLLLPPRLPSVPEESPLPADDAMYARSLLAAGFQQSYLPNQPPAGAIAAAQMPVHANTSNTQLIMADPTVKNEIGMYDNSRMYPQQNDLQNNMISTQDMIIQEPYSNTYEQTNTQAEQMQNAYGKIRPHFVNTPKIITQTDSCYTKYNTAVPPSQTAPETVSLLQQPVQNAKYASSVVIQGRAGYNREKPRARMSFHSGQMTQGHSYQGYQSGQAGFDRQQRTSPQQVQYLQPVEPYKKQGPAPASTRPFKMPSPPLAPIAPLQVSPVSPGRSKDQFRSHSLPLGAQLNQDWSVSVPAPAPQHTSRPMARPHEPHPATFRLRSRSTSSSLLADGSSGSPRRPPPLNSVASEPALPQASVMLAQLLSAQHSQSVYKLSSSEDSPKSPARRGQPSPIGSDIMSPHHSLSPPPSPGSPRAGSPPRRTHLHAEQKRRYNIKNGFDTLQALIPQLNNNPAAKISKAAMLQKGAEYIKQLKAERNQIKEEMESLRQQIECLNNSISNCHSLLPATGAPVSRARAGRLREMFARHVADRTMHNWKYWLLSVVAAALVESFSACVSLGSGADLARTTLLWAEQHCSLAEMRPAVLNSLRVLCNTTDILTSPERLPEEARAAAAASAGVKTEPT